MIDNLCFFIMKLLLICISYLVCIILYYCNELGGYMARLTQFPIMITRSTIIYEIIRPGAAGRSIYV